jgi:RNA polymerase sigma factor (sigma-70 family)
MGANLMQLPHTPKSPPQHLKIVSDSQDTLKLVTANYEYRLTEPDHVQRITQIAQKQTRGSSVDWQDALQAAQLKLLMTVRAGKFISGNEQDFDHWATTVAKFEIIDLVRKAKRQSWESTDRLFTDSLAVIDTIVDSIDELMVIERADLLSLVRATVMKLDALYPERCYQRLWLSKVQEQTQLEIAQELGLTQSAISKRWQELMSRLAIELNLIPEHVAVGLSSRKRSDQQW